MGADLIGYLIKGPRDLALHRDAAVLALTAYHVTVRTALDAYVAAGGDDLEDAAQVEALVGSDLYSAVENQYGEFLGESLEALLDTDPAEAIDTFITLWESGAASDMTSRTDPDDATQLLVFAGEMSWGDEPSGTGYQALKDAEFSGVLTALGIR